MKQQARNKVIEVKYKGYKLVQVPRNSFERKQYAKYLYSPEGKLTYHAGYSKYCSRKELRLMIRNDVNHFLPSLDRLFEDRNKIEEEDDDEGNW